MFREEIYLPLVRELGFDDQIISNSASKNVLVDAINSGRIVFYRGTFKGKLNAKITSELRKIGAVWDKKQGCFKLLSSKLPKTLLKATAASDVKFQKSLERVNKRLSEMMPEEIADKLNVKEIFKHQLTRLDKDIEENLKSISIQPQFSDMEREVFAENYTNNMKLSIKDWTTKEIVTLRETVEANTMAGVRYEGMIGEIQKRYDVSESKAKFLARQESKLMISEMEMNRYQKYGSDGYYWTCVAGSPNHPVRPIHKALDGKFISWNNPPIVNEKGERKHAGCDYGCRCKKKPRVRF